MAGPLLEDAASACRAELRLPLLRLMLSLPVSALAARRACTDSVCPFTAPKCGGVNALLVAASVSALAARNA